MARNQTENGKYAVVVFDNTDTRNEVPESWIFERNGKSFTWWPKGKNVMFHILNRTVPDKEQWDCYPVTKEGVYGKLFFYSKTFSESSTHCFTSFFFYRFS